MSQSDALVYMETASCGVPACTKYRSASAYFFCSTKCPAIFLKYGRAALASTWSRMSIARFHWRASMEALMALSPAEAWM